MSVDIARLVFELDSTQATPAEKALDRLIDKGDKADATFRKLKTATQMAGIGLKESADSGQRAVKTATELAQSQGAVERATRGAAKASADVRAQRQLEAAAMREVVQATKQLEREQAAQQARVAALKASYDPLGAAIDRTNKEIAEANALHKAGALLEAERAQATAVLTGRLNALHTAQTKGTGSAKGLNLAVLDLSRQFADIGVTAAMGMNPLMILIQQGPQIADRLAQMKMEGIGLGQAFKAMGESMGPLLGRLALIGGIFGMLAAVVGLLAKAFLDGEKEANAFSNAMKATGDFAGVAGTQFEAMSEQVARATNGGFGNARSAMLELVASGKVTGDALQNLGELSVRLGQLTGQSGAQVAKSFAQMGDDVAGFAVKFNEQYHLLTAAQIEHIRLLQEQGRQTEAAALLAGNAVEELRKRGEADLGLLERAWRSVANAIGDAWAALKGFGNESVGRNKRLEFLNEQIADIEKDGRGSISRYGVVQSKGQMDKVLQAYREERAGLMFLTQQEEAHAKAVSAGNQATQAGIRAQEEHARAYKTLGDNAAAAKAEIEKYRAGQAAIRAVTPNSRELDSAARAAAIEAAIQKKYMPAATQAANAAEKLSERLAREIKATEATAAANLALADAYGESDIAALKAEARADAVGKAIRRQGEIDTFVAAQMDANVAKQAAAGAKAAADLQARADAQERANDAVEFGGQVSAVAQRVMQAELEVRPLVVAQQYAQEAVTKAGTKATQAQKDALDAATAALEAHRKAVTDDAAAQLSQQNLAAAQTSRDQIAVMEKEVQLLGATSAARAEAIARLQEEQRQRAAGYDPATATDKQRQAYENAVNGAADAARAQADLVTTQNNYNDSLRATLDLLGEIADHTAAVASGLGEGLGRAGDALGGLVAGLSSYKTLQERFRVEEEAAVKAARVSDKASVEEKAISAKRIAEIEQLYASKRANAEVEANLAALDSFKGLFSRKSAAYKALTALETAYRAVQLAGMIKEAAADAIHTVKTIGFATARAAAHGVEAIARAMASMPFPLNLAAAAATAAALVAFGVKVFGHGGGGGGHAETAEEVQKRQGAGSVLGDATAKSESIARSLDIVAQNTNTDLEYSNSMLRALRSIDQNIGSLTGLLARQLGLSGGVFDTSGLGLGSKTSVGLSSAVLGGPLLPLLAHVPVIGGIVKSLFGTKKTTTLLDQGIQFGDQTLGDILANGLDASAYATTETKKKSKFFGISTGTSTKTKTTTSDLDDDVLREFQKVIGSLREGVLAAASTLGIEGAEATLNSLKLELDKISLKDLKGQDLQDAINAVFSRAFDQMAGAILPELEKFQKVGEGLGETLIRVARDYQVIDVSLQSIGKTFGAVGVASLEARENLIKLFGSLDDFVEQTNFFAENFLSEAERMAPIQKAVQDEFARLGVTGVNTKDQFKQLVLGLDLTTQAGQEMYAALLAVAPAFAKVFDYLNPDQAKDTGDAWRDVFKDLGDWIRSLRGEIAASVGSTAQAYAALQAAATAARAGDVGAAGRIVDLGNAYLDAVKASATSQFEYLSAVARTVAIASSVQATATAQMGAGAGSTTPFSPASATGQPAYTYTPTPTATTPASTATTSPTPNSGTLTPEQQAQLQAYWQNMNLSGLSFDTTGSFTVGGTGPKNFGPVTLHGGEIVDVRRPYQGSNDNAELIAELQDLKAEVAALRSESREGLTKVAINGNRAANVLEDFQGNGMPPTRDEDEAA